MSKEQKPPIDVSQNDAPGQSASVLQNAETGLDP